MPIVLTKAQAQKVLDQFKSDDDLIALKFAEHGWSGPGVYAYTHLAPQNGSLFIGPKARDVEHFHLQPAS